MSEEIFPPREPERTDATAPGTDAVAPGTRGELRRRAPADPGDPPPLPPRPPAPIIDQPSPDVELGQATALPGVHRGGFQRLPTEPVGLTVETAPAEPGTEARPVEWLMPEPRTTRGLAGWALAFAVVGLAMSLVVGWGFPLGLIGVIVAIVALRRADESRGMAIWALVLASVSLVYSAGWLLWAASTGMLFA